MSRDSADYAKICMEMGREKYDAQSVASELIANGYAELARCTVDDARLRVRAMFHTYAAYGPIASQRLQ